MYVIEDIRRNKGRWKIMGKVMGVLKTRLAGRADMSTVSALVKKALAKA